MPDKREINLLYLYYYLQRDSVIANGTSQQQITVPMAFRKKVLIPPMALMLQFEDAIKPFLDARDKLKEQTKNLINQRDLLLPRLMSGKLEV